MGCKFLDPNFQEKVQEDNTNKQPVANITLDKKQAIEEQKQPKEKKKKNGCC